jgi:hypothetical protein
MERSGYSADVRIQLRLDGRCLPVAQLGPDFLILRSPTDYPPSDAEIILSIDGDESRWPVRLADGITRQTQKTRVISIA